MRLQTTACVLVIMLLTGGCSYKSKFTDQGLDQRLRSNHVDFNRLVKMFKEDSELCGLNHEAAYRSYDIKANLPQPRLDDYRNLLTKLNLRSISRGEKTGNIYFATWNKSDFLIGRSNEYYVYAESAPATQCIWWIPLMS
jgi:hypothetical protein